MYQAENRVVFLTLKQSFQIPQSLKAGYLNMQRNWMIRNYTAVKIKAFPLKKAPTSHTHVLTKDQGGIDNHLAHPLVKASGSKVVGHINSNEIGLANIFQILNTTIISFGNNMNLSM